MRNRKEAVIRAALTGLAAIIAIALFAPPLVERTHLCGGCHATRAIYSSWRESPHSGTSCLACHGQPGAGGVFLNLLRGSRSVIDQVAPGGSRAAWLSDDRCLGCHERIIDDLVRTDKKTRVSHRGIIDGGRRCSECHGEVGHALDEADAAAKRFTFDKCLTCHRLGGEAGYRCDICHRKAPQERPAGALAGLLDHGSKPWKNHGLVDADVCRTCHKFEEFCGSCHKGYPEHTDWFAQRHSGAARQFGRSDCETCHRRSFCDDCHRMEIPHPAGYAMRHKEDKIELCVTCHEAGFCSRCHDSHTEHPPITGDQ